MREVDNKWDAYFEELDPEERKLIFSETAEKNDTLAGFLATLYQRRYEDPKNPGRPVDNWLWKFVYLPGLYRKRRVSKKALLTEVGRTLDDLYLNMVLSEEEEAALYREFRNAARRYLGTCLGRNYGRRLFGLKEITSDEKRVRACEELWMMSRGLALCSDKAAKMSLFIDALHAEASAFCPDCDSIYDQLEQRHKKGV